MESIVDGGKEKWGGGGGTPNESDLRRQYPRNETKEQVMECRKSKRAEDENR